MTPWKERCRVSTTCGESSEAPETGPSRHVSPPTALCGPINYPPSSEFLLSLGPYCQLDGSTSSPSVTARGEKTADISLCRIGFELLTPGSFKHMFCVVFLPCPLPQVPHHPSVLVHNRGSCRGETTPLLIDDGELDLFPCKPVLE